MKSIVLKYKSFSLNLAIIAFICSLIGCGPHSTPPGASRIITHAPGMTIIYLRWKEGLKILFVDNIKGGHHAGGSSSSNDPVYRATVTASSPDTKGYTCQIETTDGQSAKFSIDGKEYDLLKGTLFVIKSEGEKVEIHQLERDLSSIPFDAQKSIDPIQKDSEIRKLLGLKEDSK